MFKPIFDRKEMSELTEYYNSLKGYKKPEKKPHTGNWSLYYEIGGKRFLSMENKPYAMLVSVKNKLQKEVNYKRAVFFIVPYPNVK
jgi:hypothetical protein